MTPDGDVKIQLLGGFRVTAGGHDISDAAWAGRRSQELVQLLALADGHEMVRPGHRSPLAPSRPRGRRRQPAQGRPPCPPGAGRRRRHRAAGRTGQPVPGPVVPDRRRSLQPGGRQALAGDARAECARLADSYGGELLPGSLYEEWTRGGPHPAAGPAPGAAAGGGPMGAGRRDRTDRRGRLRRADAHRRGRHARSEAIRGTASSGQFWPASSASSPAPAPSGSTRSASPA